jgi:DNA-binding CsgD family transcriptional regulator
MAGALNFWVFFYYLFSLLSGGMAVSMMGFYLVKTKDPVILRYIVLYAFISLKAFSWFVDSYAGSTGIQVPAYIIYAIGEISVYCILWALPVFFHAFFSVPFRRYVNPAFYSAALAFAAWDFIALARGGGVADSNLSTVIFGIALLTVIAYSMVIGFVFYRKLKQELRKSVARAMLILFSVFLPAFVLDSLSVLDIPFSFSSLFYMAWNVTTLVFILRNVRFREGVVRIDGNFLEEYNFTKREAEILGFLVQGLSYGEIGGKTFTSIATVKTHIHHIYSKTGARNRHALIRLMGAYGGAAMVKS